MKNTEERHLHLNSLDHSLKIPKSDYKADIKKKQEKIRELTFQAGSEGRPLILVFEGWDAAGKGGAIRRLTQEIDPRLYEVHNIAAPEPQEKSRHYLWRFWNRIPKQGHVGIFDRSWYGRVLVERVESFAKEDEWMSSYEEICLFEEQLTQYGAIIVKFWLHITSDEQLKRFDARKDDPLRRWKLTDEDWRNREKWELYETAANEMFLKTHTPFSPWVLVPANDKYYARLEVLESCIRIWEKQLKN